MPEIIRCKYPGCITILSHNNHDIFCRCHSEESEHMERLDGEIVGSYTNRHLFSIDPYTGMCPAFEEDYFLSHNRKILEE